MKKIEAIIRTSKFEEVVSELSKIGVPFLTFSEVKGIGTEHATTQQYRGTAYDVGFIPRTLLEIVITDEKLDSVLDCIFEAAYTGNIGDGKIFITELVDVIRIRTGEKGKAAVG